MSSPATNGKRKRAQGHAAVVVLDYGSQYTQLICRRIRELSIYSLMLPGDVTMVRTPCLSTFSCGVSERLAEHCLLSCTRWDASIRSNGRVLTS